MWGYTGSIGAAAGLAITLPNYAIMIMGSLFALMLRPMARQIYALREANERQAALDAAAAAATEVRNRRLAALDERTRPILTRIARRDAGTRIKRFPTTRQTMPGRRNGRYRPTRRSSAVPVKWPTIRRSGQLSTTHAQPGSRSVK